MTPTIEIRGREKFWFRWNARDGFTRKDENGKVSIRLGEFTLFLSDYEASEGQYSTQTRIEFAEHSVYEYTMWVSGDHTQALANIGIGMCRVASVEKAGRLVLQIEKVSDDVPHDPGVLETLFASAR